MTPKPKATHFNRLSVEEVFGLNEFQDQVETTDPKVFLRTAMEYLQVVENLVEYTDEHISQQVPSGY